MKSTIILSSLFAALAAASPVNLDARGDPTMRIEFTLNHVPQGQADIPRINKPIKFKDMYKGSYPLRATGVNIISGDGVCHFFSDIKMEKKHYVATMSTLGKKEDTYRKIGIFNDENVEEARDMEKWVFVCLDEQTYRDAQMGKTHERRDVRHGPPSLSYFLLN